MPPRVLVAALCGALFAAGCAGSGGRCAAAQCGHPPDAGSPDAAAAACPNAIASDENCGACMKDWGTGASYCATPCSSDDDCAGLSSGWGQVDLVCHPDGYCTRTCTRPADCWLVVGMDTACDNGRCAACEGCY